MAQYILLSSTAACIEFVVISPICSKMISFLTYQTSCTSACKALVPVAVIHCCLRCWPVTSYAVATEPFVLEQCPPGLPVTIVTCYLCSIVIRGQNQLKFSRVRQGGLEVHWDMALLLCQTYLLTTCCHFSLFDRLFCLGMLLTVKNSSGSVRPQARRPSCCQHIP